MSARASANESKYLAFNPFDGERDIKIVARTVKMVTTRKVHPCCNPLYDEPHFLPINSRARYEHALVEGEWGSYYTCIACMDKWNKETT